jgi:CRISPR-associated protein Cst2
VSIHVFANIVTPYGTASNNRGENEGNITTLQKLVWMGLPHTTLSAEAIRFALRRLLADAEPTNRTYNEATRVNGWQDPSFARASEGNGFIDDDLLGYMSAEAAKEEAEEKVAEEVKPLEKGEKPPKPKKPKGTATVRRGVLEITRAVSLTPWPGDVTFNAASPGATPSAAKQGANPVPYGAEVHATRYQYGLSLTPQRLKDPGRAAIALAALSKLHTVAGNHSRFLYDFSPDSIVLRISQDPAPRLLYCFRTEDHGVSVDAPALLDRVEMGDIDAKELILGGPFARTPTAQGLRERGAFISGDSGVLEAFAEAVRRVDAGLQPKG